MNDVMALADEYLDLEAEVRQVDEMIREAQESRRGAARRRDAAGKRLRAAIAVMRPSEIRDGDLVALHRSVVLVADGYGGVSARHVDRLEAIEALHYARAESVEEAA